MNEEIERITNIPEIHNAAEELCKRKEENHIAQMIFEYNQKKLYEEVLKIIQRDRKKNLIKTVISKL